MTTDFLSKGEMMKIRTGNPVRGENFFVRKHLIDKVWEQIESENHLLLVAPRRVGKTSLMFYLIDNPKKNYYFLFLDTESVNSENEFYKKLLSKLLTSEFVKGKDKFFSFIKEHSPAIKNISTNGVEFNTKQELNYFVEFQKIIEKLELENSRLIILLDEFSQTVENIKKDESERNAIHFLQTNRELRQTISKKVQFVYSGSIGLENIVKGLNAMNTINDIAPIKVKPLNNREAKEFISKLLLNVDYELNESLIEYILHKIEWLIPFYLQLTIQAIKDLSKEENIFEITEDVIDKSFREMIEQRNYFEHWHTRLKTLFKANEYNFAKELLNIISESESIPSNDIYDLAIKHKLEKKYKDIVGSLVYDGYINNNDDVKIYRYNSPILRMWWWKYVTN